MPDVEQCLSYPGCKMMALHWYQGPCQQACDASCISGYNVASTHLVIMQEKSTEGHCALKPADCSF